MKIFQENNENPSKFDIVITHAYFLPISQLNISSAKPYLPLGPLYVASYLRQMNFNVMFYDTTFKKGIRQFYQDLHNFPSAIVGIYVFEPTRQQALQMIGLCNKEGFTTIVGGPDPSNDPQFYIENGADLVIVGEGEETMRQLLGEIGRSTKNFAGIPGVYTGKDHPFSSRPQIKNLDALPFPARDLVDLTPYFQTWKLTQGYTSLSVMASRGCPFICNWCSKPVFGNQVRLRSPANVVQEILDLKANYHPDQLWFADDIFPVGKHWVKDFNIEIKKQNATMPFECLLRVDIVNEEILSLLKEAGCFRVHFGAESGSIRVLKQMNKRTSPEQIIKATNDAHKVGLEVNFFLMLAYPGEKSRDIERTRVLIRKARPDTCGITIAFPLKGTIFYH